MFEHISNEFKEKVIFELKVEIVRLREETLIFQTNDSFQTNAFPC